ncbi:MAG: antiterminator LoaP [Clostridia bacterium]|nr:antiterminator LoaP [Clostridia bacterium]
MSWYVLHVRTGAELSIKDELTRKTYKAAAPAEMRAERRNGQWQLQKRLLLPGYIFVNVDLSDRDYYIIRDIPGVIRFLGTACPEPIRRDEEDYILWLANEDAPLSPSRLLMEGGRARVLSGPLRGREGTIVRINRRQRRAVLAITMAGYPKEISLSVDILKPDADDNI